MPDELELEGEIVVETVAGNRGLLARVFFLIHLEGAGQMLCSADHRNGNVSHENSPYNGVPAGEMEPFQDCTDAVRHAPYVLHYLHFVAVGLGDGGGIGIHFSLGGGVTLGVDYYCEALLRPGGKSAQ